MRLGLLPSPHSVDSKVGRGTINGGESPGIKTFVHPSECRDRYEIVAIIVESMAGKHVISGYPHSTFQARNSVKESFEKISDIGTTQHFVAVDRDIRKELTKFPFISDFNNYSVKHLVVFFIAYRYRENQVRTGILDSGT